MSSQNIKFRAVIKFLTKEDANVFGGLQRDYIDRLHAYRYFNYRRILHVCQCHYTIKGCN